MLRCIEFSLHREMSCQLVRQCGPLSRLSDAAVDAACQSGNSVSMTGYRQIYRESAGGQYQGFGLTILYIRSVRHCSSTQRTWADVNFSRIKFTLLPINFSGNHWIFFISVKSNLSRCLHLIRLGLQ